MFRVGLHPHPRPTLREQVQRIAFETITRRTLGEGSGRGANPPEDFSDNSVLAALRKDLVFEPTETLGILVPRRSKQLGHGLIDFELVETVQELMNAADSLPDGHETPRPQWRSCHGCLRHTKAGGAAGKL